MNQFKFWEMNRRALKFQIELARTNGYLDRLRPELPTSRSNESPVHELLRRVCPGMRVVEVARAAMQLIVRLCLRFHEFRVFTYSFYMQISFKLKRNLGGMISTSCVNKIIQRFKYIQTVIIRENII